MSDEVNVPSLRFPEFNNNWELIKLEDNAIIKGRIGWKNLKSEEYTEEGPSLIAGKHINNGIINWEDCDHITIERYDESPEIALQNGDIIFSKDGSLGNPALIKDLNHKATINGTMMLVRLNEDRVNPNYFYQVLNSDYFFRLLHILKSGSSIPHIFQRDMINFEFPLCSLNEQEKIANFLEVVDKKIELLEKTLVLYRISKTYYLNLFFNENTEFLTNDTKEIKLKNILSLQGGFNFNSDCFDETGNTKVIKIGDIPNNLNLDNFKGNYSKQECDVKYEVSNGDILIALSGATFGKSGVITGDSKAFINQRIAKFNCDNCDSKYIYQLINSMDFKRYLNRIPTSSAQPNISNKDILNYKYSIPKIEKQQEIGEFLSLIDDKIDFILKSKNQIIDFKKGLLQQMFV